MRAFLSSTFVLAAVLVASGTATAGSEEGPSRQTAVVGFTTDQPGSSTGLVDLIDYVNPSDPDAKPYAVRRVEVTLAPGSAFDTTVPARCTALDAKILLLGAAACAAASRVGGGTLTLDTGLPGPLRIVDARVTLFNTAGHVIFLFESTGLPVPARFVSRSPIVGRTLTTEAPPLPGGPPDLFTAVKSVRVNFDSVSVGTGETARHYITVPDTCPPTGHWINQATFTYYDGAVQTVLTESPCRS